MATLPIITPHAQQRSKNPAQLAWMKRHGIHTEHNDEATEPWLAHKGELGGLSVIRQLESDGLLVFGDTEEAVIKQIALNLKIKLWNQ
jgi:hypothetical protein